MSAELQDKAAFWASLRGMFYKQRLHRVPKLPPHITLEGKNAVVTGASNGLGLECARQLLQLRPAALVMAVRNLAKGEGVASKLRTEFPGAKIHVWHLDMESYESVQAFAAKVRDSFQRLDVAILNAGGGSQQFKRTEGEHSRESTLVVNYLATVLLAALLLPSMKPTPQSQAPGRLTIVGSDQAHWATLPKTEGSLLDALDSPKGYDGMEQYNNTKLLLSMFISKIPEVVNPDEVIMNVVNPCAVAGTGLMDGVTQIMPLIIVTIANAIMGRSIQEGTRQYLIAALVLDKKSHGSFVDFEIRPFSPVMYTEHGKRQTEKLWYETRKELQFAGFDEALGLTKQ